MVANKKISDGVGKKIVEALKKQSEIEITPISKNKEIEAESFDEVMETFGEDETEIPEEFFEQEDDILEDFTAEEPQAQPQSYVKEEPSIKSQPFASYQSISNQPQDNFIQDLDSFEIPSNIAVLKKLISQLPSGVSRHTGAQIIKQTMEALGISMKSVLQEAQQVQEGLNVSANECHSSIQEYKKQIMVLEKQAQNYQRQYTALNELISLFVQTGV